MKLHLRFHLLSGVAKCVLEIEIIAFISYTIFDIATVSSVYFRMFHIDFYTSNLLELVYDFVLTSRLPDFQEVDSFFVMTHFR